MKKLLLLLLLIPNLILGQCAGNQSFTLTPAPVNGNYEPGTVVTMCYTMSGWSTAFGSNWIEGFDINLGSGWVSYTPVTAPGNCSANGEWLWLETVTSDATALVAGPGYFYEGPTGPVDGNTGNDWGDFGTTCDWTFCVQLQVTDECDPLSLLIEVTPMADGTIGSWGNEACFDPAFVVFNGTVVGGDVETSPIQIPTDTICIGSTQTYAVINTPGSVYDWTLSGGGTLTANGSNTIIIDWGGTPGDYIISVQETTVDGCIGDIIDTTITVADTLIVFSQPTTGICLGDTVHLNAIPNDGYWSGGNLTGNVYTGNTPGYQYVNYTANIYGCTVTDSVRIFVRELFTAPVITGLEYIDLCLLDRTQTYYTVDDASIQYTWLMGNTTLIDTDYDLQMIWPDSTSYYTLEVFGTDTIGCRSEVGYLNVSVEACHRLFVPNSFTPNNDGFNDALKVVGLSVYNLDFRIYDRYGQLIYNIRTINQTWNGTDGTGYYCPTGSYNWIATYADDLGFKHTQKGHIILIR